MSKVSTYNRLSEIFKSSMVIPINNASKLVLISDCHRGDGSWVDDFRHNQHLFYAAMKYYYNNGYTCFDLGDGDELWKTKKISEITTVYTDTFQLLHNFYREDRYFMLFGNHDIVKKFPSYVNENLQSYYDDQTNTREPLFENIEVHEGIILKNVDSGAKLFLVHGHQGDILSDVFWKLGRFLSLHVWRRLELLGHKDPTSAAKNFKGRRKVERKIQNWIKDNNQLVICGHTHRPSCPSEDELPYFNVGSCVHPNCITCIEIVDSEIFLIKWDIKTRDDRTLYIDREPISKSRKI